MPFTVDEEKLKERMSMDVSRPFDPASGIPTKNIPVLDFPKVLYKHPREPFRKIEHRNAQHEVVHVETVPSEHLTRKVADKKELEAALKEGWVKEQYIPVAPPDPNAELYAASE